VRPATAPDDDGAGDAGDGEAGRGDHGLGDDELVDQRLLGVERQPRQDRQAVAVEADHAVVAQRGDRTGVDGAVGPHAGESGELPGVELSQTALGDDLGGADGAIGAVAGGDGADGLAAFVEEAEVGVVTVPDLHTPLAARRRVADPRVEAVHEEQPLGEDRGQRHRRAHHDQRPADQHEQPDPEGSTGQPRSHAGTSAHRSA
jgi:hypothetical protein